MIYELRRFIPPEYVGVFIARGLQSTEARSAPAGLLTTDGTFLVRDSRGGEFDLRKLHAEHACLVELADRRILPRCERGIDYCAPRILLVEHTDGRRLVWRKACRVWRNIMRPNEPEPGELSLTYVHDPLNSLDLYNEGGRLSKVVLLRFQDKIDAFFGVPVASAIPGRSMVRNTVLLSEGSW